MDWQLTVIWTILMFTLLEGCNHTCSCPCQCETSTPTDTTNRSTTSVPCTTSASTTISESTSESPTTVTGTSPNSTAVITSTSKGTQISTSKDVTSISTRMETTTSCANSTTNVTCNGTLYTIHKLCNLGYKEVINVTAYVGGYVTLQKCNKTNTWRDIEWIKYGLYQPQLCSVGHYRVTSPRNDMCFECNETSLTLYNLTTNNAGKYVLRNRPDGQEEYYYLTVSTGGVTPVPHPTGKCQKTADEDPESEISGSVKTIIETIQKANIPLGIHAVWAGIVVSVALIALYMGSRRIPIKQRYTKLPKYDPDEFWTKT
ncbi:membrane protein RL13 [Human betaherpesvirus 5]|nr:membrane protein RL13 [Human betaherpesvirus 5]AQN69793.1 membrane protein RL13 [Human betaherpesvirus 5]